MSDLEPWFESALSEIPESLRNRIQDLYAPLSWSELTPDRRRSFARQYDYDNNPAAELHREFWFNLHAERIDLERELHEWSVLADSTPTEKESRQLYISMLNEKLERLDRKIQRLEQKPFPGLIPQDSLLLEPDGELPVLIPFNQALNRLKRNLGASQEEIAAWVMMGYLDGGLSAYQEQALLRRFYYEPEMDEDYVAPLYQCKFLDVELVDFKPKERFVTGEELLELLRSEFGERVRTYIVAKIGVRGLMDMHPVKGGVDFGLEDNCGFPPLETGLFALSEVAQLAEVEGWKMRYPRRLDKFLSRKETPAERNERLHRWRDEEIRERGKPGAIKRTAIREGVSAQAVGRILRRPTK